MSSANYTINDLFDFNSDKLNPLKKNKPLVKGLISVKSAVFFSIVLIVSSLLIAYYLSFGFFLFPVALFFSTLAYTVLLKKVPLIDLLVIALNFYLRTTSGTYLLNVVISPWLILMIFLVALFLGLGKRYGELLILGPKASKLRSVFNFYSADLLKSMINIVSSMLLLGYCFYTFLAQTNPLIMLSIPVFFFAVFRYLYFIYSGNKASVESQLVFKDKQFIIALLCWILIVVLVLY